MKTNKKVFLISYGVGGAEAINSIYPKIKDNYTDIRNITITPFANAKMKNSIYIESDNILSYIKKEKPDVLINERSNGTKIQNDITSLCKKLGIFNIALLDFYGAYKERFESRPDIIISPSLTITKEMIDEGFNKKSIITAGNPAFDRLENYNYSKVRNTIDPKIIFTSQYLQEAGFPKSQYEIFTQFYFEIKDLYKDAKIEVKIHPNENMDNWVEFLKDFKDVVLIQFDTSKDFLEQITVYDLVAGYNSTVQLQTYMMHISTVYYELDNTKKALLNFKKNVKIIQRIKYSDFERNAVDKVSKTIIDLINKL